MKRIISLAILLTIIACTLTFTVGAAEKSVKVFVTVSDGTLALTYKEVNVTDADGDGKLTVNDAVIIAHKENNKDGESAYAYATGDYGLYITKLWGVENGGAYGSYKNNVSATLGEEVKDNDYICVFCYTDITGYSDKYCYFEPVYLEATAGVETVIKLKLAYFDESFNSVVGDAIGFKITCNGDITPFESDALGEIHFKDYGEGTYILTAETDDGKIVPPVCKVVVSAAKKTDNNNKGSLWIYIAISAFAVVAVICAVGIIAANKRASAKK